jgi:hypothetical protein
MYVYNEEECKSELNFHFFPRVNHDNTQLGHCNIFMLNICK